MICKKIDNVLVTGASGLVGSAVVKRLRFEGSCNIMTPTHTELDLIDSDLVKRYFDTHEIEYVIHCAGSVAGIVGNQNDQFNKLYKNVQMGINVITSFKNRIDNGHSCEKMMFLGSTCIYPRDCKQPISEDCLLDGKLEKTNEGYALSKICCIKLCEYLNNMDAYRGKFITCMPTNVYGINDNYNPKTSHVVASLIKKVYDATVNNSECVSIGGDGTPIRSLLNSDDLADAIIFLLKNYGDSQHVNIGSHHVTTIKNLAQMISEIIGFKGKFIYDSSIPNGTPVKIEDSTLIEQLGWKSSISLRDGLSVAIHDYEQKFYGKQYVRR